MKYYVVTHKNDMKFKLMNVSNLMILAKVAADASRIKSKKIKKNKTTKPVKGRFISITDPYWKF